MGTITVGQENSTPIELYYEDHGSGPAVVLLSGWPVDSRSWEPQVPALLEAGHRVISYDRRGFGQSSRPTVGYDFDTLAGDLDKVLAELDVRDATLVGFSLGTGELARYVGTYGNERLQACVFIESLAPSFARSGENPNGVDEAGVVTVQQAILDDRFAWLTGLLGDFLNLDQYLGKRVSEEVGYILAGTVRMEIEGHPTLTLHAGEPFLMPPRTPHNALDLGLETGRMLSTYIVEVGEPIATFTRP
jgi:non-heme chloroperoxidase